MHQLSRRSIPFPLGMLSYLTILALLSATLTGCLAVSWVEDTAKGEPKDAGYFALSTSGNAYEITRWWGVNQMTYHGKETLIVPSRDFPVGCDAVRFFLNDSAHELQIAQPASANWVTEDRPPPPDDSYPPCTLLVSYGSFSEPPVLEGVAVTSATGLVATSERLQPHPAVWALLPVGIAADVYIFAGALVTMPVWAPIGLLMEKNTAKSEKETKEKEKASLPPPVAACWTAIDKVMDKSVASKPDQPFVGFRWAPVIENAYVLTAVNEVFSNDKPVPIDARVTLRQGRVQFPIKNMGFIWTDADVECGLLAGEVVSTCVKLRK